MLSKFSVKKPMTILVGVILILGLGFLSFSRLKTDLLPNIDLPFVVVVTTYPGASPEKVEETVTKPLENAVSTVSGIENITSTSSENQSMIMLEFGYNTNMDSALIEVNTQIDMVEGYLEDGVIPPMVIKMNPDMMPIMILGASYEGVEITELSEELSTDIIPELERAEGVGAITGTGLVEEQLQINLQKDKVDEINEELAGEVNSQLGTAMNQLEEGEKSLAALKKQLNSQLNAQTSQLTTEEKNTISRISQIESELLELQSDKTQVEIKLEASPADIALQAELAQLNVKIQTNQAEKQILESILIDMSAGRDGIVASFLDLMTTISIQESQLQSQRLELESEREEYIASADMGSFLTADTISGILQAQNFSMPAGYISDGDTEFSLKIGEAFKTIEEIENLVIFDTGSKEVKLSDVAKVSVVEKREDVYSKVNGEDAIILSIQRQSNISTAEASEALNEKIKEIEAANPGLKLTPLMDQGVYIDIIIKSVFNNLIIGGIFAILILFLFLRNIRPTVVVSLSIPISIMFAIVLMYFSGVNLNMISLAGLALGVGMLLDNSIVVMENIFRIRQEGVSPLKAAVLGAKQVAGAITASTLTTICVFMPILFTDGISRQLFMDMGLTIGYSLLASLIIALTLIPSLSSTILKKELKPPGRFFEKTLEIYKRLLNKALRKRALIIGVSIGLLIASAGIATQTGIIFIPEGNSDEMTVTITGEVDDSVEEVREVSDQLVEDILEIEDIETVGAIQGAMMGQGNSVSVYIKLKGDRENTSQEVAEEINEIAKEYPVETQVTASTMDMSALTGAGIQIKVMGNDLDTLLEISNEIEKQLTDIDGVKEITNGQEGSAGEKRITVDKNKAASYGLTVAQIYQEISGSLTEEVESTTVNVESEDYQVVVIKDKEEVLTYDELAEHVMTIESATGEVEVKLSDVATFGEAEGLLSIAHEDLTRILTVQIDIDENKNIALVARDVEEALAGYQPPEGYTIEFAGENETIMETMADLLLMIAVAMAFIYLIMVAQFQALLSPFIIMFTMPLAFTGGFLALVICGKEISTIAMLGFVMLSGIVVNNGIVFVDYVNKLRGEGMEKREALITAGSRRLRPIVMTALTTILGLSTLALGIGTGTDIISPMAIVVIGGLLYATLMTLFVVPIMYDLLYKKDFKIIKEEDLEEEKELDKI